jgi:small-conductance mechanosensitive channel
MSEFHELGQRLFLQNDLASWAKALVQFAVWFTVLPLLKRFLTRRLRKLEPAQSSAALELALELLRRTTRIFLIVVAVYLAVLWLTAPERLDRWLTGTLLLFAWLQVALWGTATVRFFVDRRMKRDAEAAKESAASLNILKFVGTAAIWAIASLLLLANLGIDVTALIAGLGVGGIAIALAVQKVLGDLLASLSIALDKPFKVGDFLVVGEEKGTVEHIGIKSTRLRSITGEQVVMSNADLLASRVHNFGLLYERRIAFRIGITYETPRDKVAEVPQILEEIIRAQPKTRFDRAHFASFGAFSLDYEAVYFVLDPAYNVYMDIQQAINLRLLEVFRQRGIDFAYPTQVEYSVGGPPPAVV